MSIFKSEQFNMKSKAERMHLILLRVADIEKYHHNQDKFSDAVMKVLSCASEETKERMYEFLMEE